MFKNNF